jgi:hypothetical protein
MQYPLTNFDPKHYVIVWVAEFKFVVIRMSDALVQSGS